MNYQRIKEPIAAKRSDIVAGGNQPACVVFEFHPVVGYTFECQVIRRIARRAHDPNVIAANDGFCQRVNRDSQRRERTGQIEPVGTVAMLDNEIITAGYRIAAKRCGANNHRRSRRRRVGSQRHSINRSHQSQIVCGASRGIRQGRKLRSLALNRRNQLSYRCTGRFRMMVEMKGNRHV